MLRVRDHLVSHLCRVVSVSLVLSSKSGGSKCGSECVMLLCASVWVMCLSIVCVCDCCVVGRRAGLGRGFLIGCPIHPEQFDAPHLQGIFRRGGVWG